MSFKSSFFMLKESKTSQIVPSHCVVCVGLTPYKYLHCDSTVAFDRRVKSVNKAAIHEWEWTNP